MRIKLSELRAITEAGTPSQGFSALTVLPDLLDVVEAADLFMDAQGDDRMRAHSVLRRALEKFEK